ncbi:META domain-containing protein [Kribbella sp. VKM Ac-2569]|uniref:META domain-containing protein n=1 Tax=Kribbella sp. VKM Ac-2569 TaxID=2512220 RepID=UPI00102B8100|nr:META domain-containing protein [Kribbella sp. VKM Ac-2569]RZT27222.1 META domain-containing protein [Kribbella sp. VKM Ac-2569]
MTLVYGPLIGGEGSPLGKTYLSVAVTEDDVERELVPGTRIRVEIRKDGVLIARAGCNELSGGIMLDDGVLRFERAIQTQMGCGPEFEAQDDWLMRLLLDEPEWSVEGDTLTLIDGGTTIVLLDRRFAEPDLPLDGTTWTIESVVRGGLFQHYFGVGPATLTLDGTEASGSTGSSPFIATVTRDNDTLTFTDLTVAPGHPTALEEAVLESLRTPLTYTIESNHLKLRGPTRTAGLNLKAPRPEGTPYPSF